LITPRAAVTLRVASLNVAAGQGLCSTAGSAIALRDWLFRQTRDRREPAEVKCGRRAICDKMKGLTAVNLARMA
jgi:hypothetical protein